MNNLRVNASIPDLTALDAVGTDTYAFVGKFFKQSDGTPLGSSHIANVNPLTSVITNPASFVVNVPVENATYLITGVELRLFANESGDCCFARINIGDINNTFSPSVSAQAVLMSGLGNPKVYRYEPSTDEVVDLFDALNSGDIAHTATKLFNPVFGPGSTYRIREYDITLSPFSQTFSKFYDIATEFNGPGLCAISNTLLYVAGFGVTEVNIVGTTATPTNVFNFATGYHCTGDLIYDATTQLFLIAYDNGTDYRIGVFQRNGTIVRSATAPVNNVYGIYQFGGNTFLIDGNGIIYTLNLTTLATTPSGNTDTPISGASQIQSNISIPA